MVAFPNRLLGCRFGVTVYALDGESKFCLPDVPKDDLAYGLPSDNLCVRDSLCLLAGPVNEREGVPSSGSCASWLENEEDKRDVMIEQGLTK